MGSPQKAVKLKASALLRHVSSQLPVLLTRASRSSATFQRKLADTLRTAQTDKLIEVRQVAKELLGHVDSSKEPTQPEADALSLTRELATKENKQPRPARRPSASDDELQKLLTSSASTVTPRQVWKARARALEELMTRQGCREVQEQRFLDAVDDCNVKVQEVALEFFRREAEAKPAGLEHVLPRLLLQLIERQTSAKHSVSQPALFIKHQILKYCQPRKVLEAVLRSPIPAKPRAKAELLGILRTAGRQSELSDKAVSLVLNYLAVLHDKPVPVLVPDSLKLCEELGTQSTPTLLACLYEMDLHKRTKVLRLLKGSELELKYKQFIGEQPGQAQDTQLPSAVMTSLAERLTSSGAARLQALVEVKSLAHKLTTVDQHLLVSSLKACVAQEAYSVKEATLAAVRAVGGWTWFKPVGALFAVASEGLTWREEELREASKLLLRELIATRGYDDLLQTHLLLISEAVPEEAVELVRLLSDSLSFVPDLVQKLPSVLATLRKVRSTQLLENSKPEIRKVAIFCVVEAKFILGAKFDQFVDSLSPGQVRLVAYYMARRSQAVHQSLFDIKD
jgi:hypothetical protein